MRIANSPEFWKKPGGPLKPHDVKENPLNAQAFHVPIAIFAADTRNTPKKM